MNSSAWVTDNQIIEACKNSNFMNEAAAKVGLHISTLKTRAEKLGVYNPADRIEASKKGGQSFKDNHGFVTEDIFNGKHPQYSSYLLGQRLVKEHILEYKCSGCGITEWNNNPISLDLDHINGIHSDHRKENLRFMCPNCHSQTPTYKSKNKK